MQREQIDAMVAQTLDRFGKVDALVNNAQTFRPQAPLATVSEDDVDVFYTSGVKGSLWAMQAVHPHMQAAGWGRIVNFASAAGITGMRGYGAYNASKEAIRALTRTAAREWGRDGIVVNCIAPGAASKRGQESAGATHGGLRAVHPGAPDGPAGRPGGRHRPGGAVPLFRRVPLPHRPDAHGRRRRVPLRLVRRRAHHRRTCAHEPRRARPRAPGVAPWREGPPRPVFRLRDLDRRARWVALAFALALALAPILAFAWVVPEWAPAADPALMGLRALDVGTSHTPLIGQPSSSRDYGGGTRNVDHLGPTHFYLLAAPVRLLGGDIGMPLVSVLIVGGCVLIAAWAVFRQLGPAAGVLAAVVLGTITFTTGASSLVDPVSSNIAGYPLLCSAVLLWCVVCGDVRLLPLTVGVVSFAMQQHLSVVPACLVLTAGDGGGHRPVPPSRPSLAAAGGAPRVGAVGRSVGAGGSRAVGAGAAPAGAHRRRQPDPVVRVRRERIARRWAARRRSGRWFTRSACHRSWAAPG